MNRSSRKVAGATGQRRIFNPVSVGAVIVIVALIAVITANFVHKHHDKQQAAADVAPPAVFTADGRLHFGTADTVVTVITDFQCPICHQFETTTGPTLTDMVAAGTVSADYDTVAVLNGLSKDNYSTRAANAGTCVAVADKSLWPEFSKRLFENQPAEGGPGLTDDRLVQIAADAGVTGPDLADCVHSGRYNGFVASHSEKAITAGLTHVPVVKVGDTTLDNLGPDGLRAAISRATSAGK
ncbi:thioredoxin domain-containing protein [Nocardia sp. ET3-3]|uniref:Thioredoxin domain-containing protein n=1 Tax=Nocardia terrae TaxID=2675851 RepID=A0A7K1V9F1_9NOCA|nr:thioredoxin domain-containing protein [Nocardia terrae]MVU83273.1 thioredoxin domain-containing protein [Nocardia terrae]